MKKDSPFNLSFFRNISPRTYSAAIASSTAFPNIAAYEYGRHELLIGHTTPLNYFLTYNLNDFGIAALGSFYLDYLLEKGFERSNVNPIVFRSITFLAISAFVGLTETVLPQGFVGNTRDVMDIPMGIAGAAFPLITQTLIERSQRRYNEKPYYSRRAKFLH